MRCIHHLFSRLLEAVAKVDFFEIHEDPLVHETDLFHGRFSQHNAAPLDEISFPDDVVVLLSEAKFCKKDPVSKNPFEDTVACYASEEDGDEPGKTSAGELKRTVLVENHAAACASVGAGVHEISHPLDRISNQIGIAVKQQNIPAAAASQHLVICFGKSNILRISDQPHTGEFLFHHLRAAVR